MKAIRRFFERRKQQRLQPVIESYADLAQKVYDNLVGPKHVDAYATQSRHYAQQVEGAPIVKRPHRGNPLDRRPWERAIS